MAKPLGLWRRTADSLLDMEERQPITLMVAETLFLACLGLTFLEFDNLWG